MRPRSRLSFVLVLATHRLVFNQKTDDRYFIAESNSKSPVSPKHDSHAFMCHLSGAGKLKLLNVSTDILLF